MKTFLNFQISTDASGYFKEKIPVEKSEFISMLECVRHGHEKRHPQCREKFNVLLIETIISFCTENKVTDKPILNNEW